MTFLERNRKDVVIFLSIFLFWALAFYFRDLPVTPPTGGFHGDTASYTEAVKFIETGIVPRADFTPNRLLTNFAYLRLLILFQWLGNIYLGWIFLNSLFYILSGFILYKIIYKIFKSDKVSALASLIFLGNYAALTFGLNYLTDMGSWMFYFGAAYFSLNYLYDEKYSDIYLAAVMVGLGGLFKEYALGGYFIILGSIFYIAYLKRERFLKTFILVLSVSLVSFLPVALVHFSVFFKYHYTYLDFINFMRVQPEHLYQSRILEHLKVLGYLFNFSLVLFLDAVHLLYTNWEKYFDSKQIIFVSLSFLSASPILFYPGITERLDFILALFFILISSVAIKEHEDRPLWLALVLIPYIMSGFVMDSYILQPQWKQSLISRIKSIYNGISIKF